VPGTQPAAGESTLVLGAGKPACRLDFPDQQGGLRQVAQACAYEQATTLLSSALPYLFNLISNGVHVTNIPFASQILIL
jgi:hypothetical protein